MLNVAQEVKGAQIYSMFTDNIGQSILSKLGGINSQIAISDLPFKGIPSIHTLARLYRFEEWNLLTTKFGEKGGRYERVFYPTETMLELKKQLSAFP